MSARHAFLLAFVLALVALVACVSDEPKKYIVVSDDGGSDGGALDDGGMIATDAGGGGTTEAGPAIDANGPSTKVVFITKDAHAGNLGGIAGADAACTAAAQGKLAGTFKAWLSDGAADPASRFDLTSTAALVGTDGTTLAASLADLVATGAGKGLLHAIDHDETDSTVTGTNIAVWTNVSADGTKTKDSASPDYHCAGWTPAGTTGAIGHADDIASGHWTAAGTTASCTSTAHLYCFEQ
jgi:hypothetical protein